MSYYDKYLKYKSKYKSQKSVYGVWNDMPSELYVIGDIHGDFFALKQSLELTECIIFDTYNEKLKYDDNNKLYYLNDGCDYYTINHNIKWNENKKNCFIVLAGDLIDRCRQDQITNPNCINTISDENCDYKILKLLFDLDKEAQKYNSRIIIVLGNHELFNIRKDLRYVSLKGRNDINRLNNINNLLIENFDNIYGIVRINSYVIVHGGINNNYFKLFNENNKVESYETIELYNKYIRNVIKLAIEVDYTNINLELQDETPFMDRSLGLNDFNINQCKEIFLDNILNVNPTIKDKLKIIVSHCPQFIKDKGINLNDCQEYKNRIYKIDIGMSRAFDFYKSADKLNNYLINNNNKTKFDYTYFYDTYNDSRMVSILKLTSSQEIVLKGKLSIDYFYNTAFKEEKDKFLYLFSDIKKILKLNKKTAENEKMLKLLDINIHDDNPEKINNSILNPLLVLPFCFGMLVFNLFKN